MVSKVLLAGCGQMGKAHLSSLQLLQNERKVGSLIAVDTDSSRLASLGEHVRGYTSLETALMVENPELIVLATNTVVHGQNIKKILDYVSQSGNNSSLFVEKPFVESSVEVEKLKPELEHVGYASTIPLAFAYLIRFSPVVEDAISYLNRTSTPLRSAEILWQKKRKPERPSAGIHIDETTHGIDTFCYLLESSGRKMTSAVLEEREADYDLSIVDAEAQRRLYGEAHVPMARVRYRFSLDGVSLSGFSSFLDEPQRREMKLTLADDSTLSLFFDTVKKDVFQRHNSQGELVEIKEYSLDTPQSNRVYQELTAMLQYHQTKVRPQNLASLEDAIRDVIVTEMLGRENLILPYRFKI